MKPETFLNGAPVAPDVEKLLEAYPPEGLTEGKLIDYEAVLTVIDVKERNPRFSSVVSAWRKKLMERGILLRTEPNIGFVVMNAKESLEKATRTQRTATRAIVRSAKEARAVPAEKLDEVDRKRLDNLMQKNSTLLGIAKIRGNFTPPSLTDGK